MKVPTQARTPITYFSLGALLAVIISWTFDGQYMSPYDYGFGSGFSKGYRQGKVDALLPSATNHELQDVCANLWISEQIKN